ncbi:hypothetical protein B5G20_01350 [Collinsella sp. An7]|nr:hypothetical protein B5G20_01350 [Collinsella sp. An7]
MSSTSELYREALDGFALAPEVKARMVTRLVAALENEGEVGGADPTMPECSVRVPFASHPPAVSGLAPSPSGRPQRAVLPWQPRRTGRLQRAGASWTYPYRIAATVLLLMCLAGVTSVQAAGVFRTLGAALSDLFGPVSAETAQSEGVAAVPGVSCTDAGLTLTAEAVVGDARSCVIVYSLSTVDGDAFDTAGLVVKSRTGDAYLLSVGGEGDAYPLLRLAFSEVEARVNGEMPCETSLSLYDADPSDNAVQVVQRLVFGEGQLDGAWDAVPAASVRFSRLCTWDTSGEETVADGTWELEVPLAYTQGPCAFTAGQTVSVGGHDAQVTALEMSPVSIHVRYTVDTAPLVTYGAQSSDGQGVQPDAGSINREAQRLALASLDVVMRDGERIRVLGIDDDQYVGAMPSSIGRNANGQAVVTYDLTLADRVVDPDEVEAVVINDAVEEGERVD